MPYLLRRRESHVVYQPYKEVEKATRCREVKKNKPPPARWWDKGTKIAYKGGKAKGALGLLKSFGAGGEKKG